MKPAPARSSPSTAASTAASVLDHRSVAYRAFTGPVIPAAAANSPGWRSADLGGGNGHGNASALVELFAPLTTGSLLKSSTVDLIFDEQSNGPDLVHGRHTRWGIGFALPDPRTLPWIPSGRVAFWGGWGGSMLIADLDRQLTIGYVMNDLGTDLLGGERAAAYVTAIYAALVARCR
ncbi:serine hydrolase [Kribbella sp. NPDC020789]